MNLSERIYNGDRAKEILENEVFQQTFHDIKQELTQKWMESPARDQEAREKIWLMLKMLEKVEATLKQTLDSGKLAIKELEHQRSLVDRVKSAFS